jgi:hypothetical protein
MPFNDVFSFALPKSATIGESLQDFAHRICMPVSSAYFFWHEHGRKVARAWQVPCRVDNATNSLPSGAPAPHVVVRGGNCLGLTASDVRALVAGRH